jgi:hypothetical protein
MEIIKDGSKGEIKKWERVSSKMEKISKVATKRDAGCVRSASAALYFTRYERTLDLGAYM